MGETGDLISPPRWPGARPSRSAAGGGAAAAALSRIREAEARLDRKRKELTKAATVVESLEAMKTFPDEALGMGHPIGGAKAHRNNRLEVLNRLRLRSKLLSQDLANDWDWFVSSWDKAVLDKLEGVLKDSGARRSATLSPAF